MADSIYNDEKFIYSLYSEMEKRLKQHRFIHSVMVAGTAAALAMKYGADPGRAQVAGILHDNAKCYDDEELVELCRKKDIAISDFEEKHGFLLHAKYGAYVARKKYGIEDEDVLNAIRWHTTGHENMTLLEKIIFVADYMEPLRNKAKNLDLIRDTVLNGKDIDDAVRMIMHDTLDYLHASDFKIDPVTQAAYDHYTGLIN